MAADRKSTVFRLCTSNTTSDFLGNDGNEKGERQHDRNFTGILYDRRLLQGTQRMDRPCDGFDPFAAVFLMVQWFLYFDLQ
jgi:hypothetical protein